MGTTYQDAWLFPMLAANHGASYIRRVPADKGSWKQWVARAAMLCFLALLGATMSVQRFLTPQHDPSRSTSPWSCVHPAGVDYDCIDQAKLAPQLIAWQQAKSSSLADDLNAYNQWVLYLVRRGGGRSLSSVNDVHGWFEPTQGFGFFFAQWFKYKGSWTNLYLMERDIRAQGDARIHAALNCASRSCPPLASEPYRSEALDSQLDAAMSAFIGTDIRAPSVSKIFLWYGDDYAAHARSKGWGKTWRDFVRHYDASFQIDPANIQYEPYDWRLNQSKPRK